MGAEIMTTSSTMMCPHGGQISVVPAQQRASAGGTAVTSADMATITGCAFTIGTTPSPCLNVMWLLAATRVTAAAEAIITAESSGVCVNAAGAPQGPVTLVPNQWRALAS